MHLSSYQRVAINAITVPAPSSTVSPNALEGLGKESACLGRHLEDSAPRGAILEEHMPRTHHSYLDEPHKHASLEGRGQPPAEGSQY